MRGQSPYAVGLTIRHSHKGIPYGAAPRPDGQANHGFRNIKGAPERANEIPELVEDPAMCSLVTAIANPANGLATIGCASWPDRDERGFSHFGYIEFVINSVLSVSDAAHYFPLFFHFDRMLDRNGFAERVRYHWELMGASFLDSGIDGYTATVHVHIAHCESEAESRAAWAAALDPLVAFLAGIPIQPGPLLF